MLPAPPKLKIAFLILYIVGILGSLAIGQIRTLPNYQVLLGLTVLYFIGLTLLDSQKACYYLVHIVPFYLTMVALFLSWCWIEARASYEVLGPCFRWNTLASNCRTTVSGETGQLSEQLSPCSHVSEREVRRRGGSLITSGVAFGLGFPQNVVHDPRLGFYSRKRFDYIVIDRSYGIRSTRAGPRSEVV